jgi:hypothetical protein
MPRRRAHWGAEGLSVIRRADLEALPDGAVMMTCTEGLCVKVVQMPSLLDGFLPIERACVKLDVFFQVLVMFLMKMCFL